MIEKLILVVSGHRQFGWKVGIHVTEILTGESLLIKGVPSADESKELSGPEIKIIQTLHKVSDEILLKSYSKEKDKSKISRSAVDNLFRPPIEKANAQVIQLALQADIPVYIKDDVKSKAISEYNRLEILPEPSTCIFHFIKEEEGLRYFISLSNGNKDISLQQKRAIVLSDKPCVVLLGNSIHQVDNIEAKKLVPFFSRTAILVPASSEKEYIRKFVIKTIPKYKVNIQGIEVKEITPGKKAILTLEEDLDRRLSLALYFVYDEQTILPFSLKKKIVSIQEKNGTEIIVWFNRDEEWEKNYVTLLQHIGLQRVGENRFYLKGDPGNEQPYGLIEWLNKQAEELKIFEFQQKGDYDFYRGEVKIISSMDVGIDWFDLKIEVVLDNFRIPFSRFRKHILSGIPEFVLPDGRIFILPKEWFKQYLDLFLYSETRGEEIGMKKIHAPVLHDSLDDLMMSDRKQEVADFIAALVEQPVIPANLDKILRPYQRKGFYWLNHLRRMNFGGCLADDMGLGKTLQTITLLEYVYASSEKLTENPVPIITSVNGQISLFQEPVSNVPASLIVVPTSLLHNWRNELKKFAPHLKVYIHAGNKRLKTKDIGKIFKHYQVIVTSYGTLRIDIDYLNSYDYEYIILDESQHIKNPDSVLYRAVQTLKSSHRLVLTGTPIENSLIDLWTQFSFINPGLLGSLSSFKEDFVHKILKEKNNQVEESLQRLIRPFILRRTKEEVTPDLPSLSQEIVYCDMTEAQEKVYQEEKNSIRNRLLSHTDLFVKNRFVALQSLIKLRLLANHPVMAKPEYTGNSGKMEQILLYFETIKASGHKVLIFSSFVKHLKLLAKYFKEKGWKYAFLSGQTRNREEVIKKFNSRKEINCFFISLKAGGTGLNLTSADYVFIIDPWWNPAAEMQALSRAHRIGQEKSVMVYRFISDNTIEEKILQLQQSKSRLSETFITSGNPLKDMSERDIEELFN